MNKTNSLHDNSLQKEVIDVKVDDVVTLFNLTSDISSIPRSPTTLGSSTTRPRQGTFFHRWYTFSLQCRTNSNPDDLPIIKDNIKKGWSTFLGRVKSKLDGEPEQPPPPPPRPGEYGYHQRYDADPRVLGDDFTHLKIQDQSAGTAPRQSHRPLANPNLFKSARFSNNSETNSTPPAMPPRPDQQASAPSALPTPSQTQTPGGPSPTKKWEPLRPAEDRDPFAVGDSDDEEAKEEDLYGTAPVKATAPQVGAQESGIVTTPLDPAVDGKTA